MGSMTIDHSIDIDITPKRVGILSKNRSEIAH